MITIVLTLLFLNSVSLIEIASDGYDVTQNVVYRLHTRKNRRKDQILEIGNEDKLLQSNFLMDKPVIIFCHGWTTIPETALVVKTFLDWSDVNVLVVDWTKGSCRSVEIAVSRVPLVGEHAALFLDWLSTVGVSFDNFHIIGISMGCHVAGIIGRNCRLGKVAYITACDPIRDHFEDTPNCLQPNDAKYVEVIHTNAGRHGVRYPLGTADFYPNSGTRMPGCKTITLDNCSHAVSLQYYMNSIDHQMFVAKKCSNYDEILSGNCSNLETSYMGGAFPKNISGIYYLTTNSRKPFYKG